MAIHYGIAQKDRPKIAFQTGTECQKHRFVRGVLGSELKEPEIVP
jgi:hypothetical protein